MKQQFMHYFAGFDLTSCQSGKRSHVEGLIYGLRKLGWTITLFSNQEPASAGKMDFPFKNIRIKTKGASLKYQFTEQLKLLILLFRHRGPKPDAIYIRNRFLMLAPVIYALSYRIPFFYEINALKEAETKFQFLLPLALLLEKYVLKKANAVFLVTEALRQYYLKKTQLSPNKFFTITNGADSAIYHRTCAKKKLNKKSIIGFIGNFQPRQGVSTLLYAVPMILEACEAHFIIAGHGTESDKYRSLAKQLGIETYITFPGFVQGDALIEMLNTLDIAVAPYAKALADVPMGSPLKVYTYLLAGKPVILSDLPALNNFKECKAVFFVKPDDPDSLARSVVELLRMDKAPREKLETIASQYVLCGHTWDAVAKRVNARILTYLPIGFSNR